MASGEPARQFFPVPCIGFAACHPERPGLLQCCRRAFRLRRGLAMLLFSTITSRGSFTWRRCSEFRTQRLRRTRRPHENRADAALSIFYPPGLPALAGACLPNAVGKKAGSVKMLASPIRRSAGGLAQDPGQRDWDRMSRPGSGRGSGDWRRRYGLGIQGMRGQTPVHSVRCRCGSSRKVLHP